MKKQLVINFLLSAVSLFSQENDREESFPVPPNEQLQFSEERARFFDKELSLTDERPPFLPPSAEIEAYALSCRDGGWRICIEFPFPILYKATADPCTLCLELNQDISSVDFSQVEEALQYVTNRFESAYNTLSLTTVRPAAFCVQREDHCLILDIYPDYHCPAFVPRALKVARIRLLVEKRLFAPAFCALKNFLCEYPGDRDGWFLLSELEEHLPRWQHAVSVLCWLRERFPYDSEIQFALHDAFYPHSSFVRFERESIRYIHQAMEHVWRASGEYIIRNTPQYYTYLGGAFEFHRGHLSEVVQLDGTTEGFLGNRIQGQLYVRNEWRDGFTIAATLYGTEGVSRGVGLRLDWLVPCLQAEMAIFAAWHKPYWDTYETFAHFGREDILYGEFSSIWNRFFDFYLNGGVHRVGIAHVTNGWSSLLINWGAYCHFCVTDIVDLALHYDFDGEYVYHHDTRLDADGDPFEPVPLETYEFHTLTIDATYDYANWRVAGAIGYTQNWMGIGGINAELEFRYRKPCPCGWEAAIRAARFPSSTAPRATEETLNFELTIRF